MSSFWLEYIQDGQRREFSFDKASVSVGRDKASDFVVPGPGTVTITPAFAGHTFSPAERVLTVVDNLTDIDFDDTQTYTLSGKAVGGDCNLALGADGRVDLTVTGGGGGTNPGLGQVGDACDEPGFDPDCQIGTLCKLDTGTCEETCDTPGSCAGGACCQLSGYGNCSEGVFFSWCTP